VHSSTHALPTGHLATAQPSKASHKGRQCLIRVLRGPHTLPAALPGCLLLLLLLDGLSLLLRLLSRLLCYIANRHR
jgi:hypothetical protein